jgi:2-deoxy-D-gluconate 3-dehydrogenase
MEDWDFVINANLTTVFAMHQLAACEYLKNGGGKIINVASMLSFFGGYTVSSCLCSKQGWCRAD